MAAKTVNGPTEAPASHKRLLVIGVWQNALGAAPTRRKPHRYADGKSPAISLAGGGSRCMGDVFNIEFVEV